MAEQTQETDDEERAEREKRERDTERVAKARRPQLAIQLKARGHARTRPRPGEEGSS
jgi:hypothetical protein